MTKRNTEFFPSDLGNEIASQFIYLNEDPAGNKRLFFENAGGSLRLKAAVDAQSKLSSIPDCPERTHDIALEIREIIKQGERDIRLFLNAKDGTVAASLTASKLMFEMVTVIASASEKGNIVTTAIEHPSSFDACQLASDWFGHELRVADANPASGSIPLDHILELIDENTVMASIIMTSNITGAMHDIHTYASAIREKNPAVFIVVDAVQGAPHGPIDVNSWGIDALNIAPYKMFGNRGIGFAYLSDRVACLPHHRLLATPENNWSVGSPTPAHYASFSKVIDYICRIGAYFINSEDRRALIEEGMNRIHLQEQAILHRLLNGSERQPGTKQMENVNVHFEEINGVNQDLILALTFDNLSCTDVILKYGEQGILVYARESTSHYSKRILNAVSLDAIVRVSPIHCHREEDVDRFLEVTEGIAAGQI
ncbi:aminotransferase class V-fold PLP-dependent enzyme [Siminovitchia sp. FSL H7-0308]|uniref:aminotransferase class V-fold PLP-dependent enzyme n=1 Tax=Siminovitchia sp. FSL H7-0308 TaxID=2921432 RepID=UPI0030EF20C9